MRKLKIEDGAVMKLGDRGLEVRPKADGWCEPKGPEPVEERPSEHLERIRLEAEWNVDRGRLEMAWKRRYNA
jgi:hypothetical protein